MVGKFGGCIEEAMGVVGALKGYRLGIGGGAGDLAMKGLDLTLDEG